VSEPSDMKQNLVLIDWLSRV